MMVVYADETCTHSSHGKYMIISAITLEKDIASDLRKQINTLSKKLPQSEFHFSKMTPSTVDIYKKIVDLFFDFYDQKQNQKRGIEKLKTYRKICFDAIIIEHKKVNHPRFNQGDEKLGFLRFYKTLLKFIVKKYYRENETFYIVPDDLHLKKGLLLIEVEKKFIEGFDSVQHLINLDFQQDYGVHNVINKIQKQNSKAEPLLQMIDVILGLVMYNFNGCNYQNSNRGKAKQDVLLYFQQKCTQRKIKLSLDTISSYRSFNLWLLKLQ
jgi:hypothetical protein